MEHLDLTELENEPFFTQSSHKICDLWCFSDAGKGDCFENSYFPHRGITFGSRGGEIKHTDLYLLIILTIIISVHIISLDHIH